MSRRYLSSSWNATRHPGRQLRPTADRGSRQIKPSPRPTTADGRGYATPPDPPRSKVPANADPCYRGDSPRDLHWIQRIQIWQSLRNSSCQLLHNQIQVECTVPPSCDHPLAQRTRQRGRLLQSICETEVYSEGHFWPSGANLQVFLVGVHADCNNASWLQSTAFRPVVEPPARHKMCGTTKA
jgi:hypothetical protein